MKLGLILVLAPIFAFGEDLEVALPLYSQIENNSIVTTTSEEKNSGYKEIWQMIEKLLHSDLDNIDSSRAYLKSISTILEKNIAKIININQISHKSLNQMTWLYIDKYGLIANRSDINSKGIFKFINMLRLIDVLKCIEIYLDSKDFNFTWIDIRGMSVFKLFEKMSQETAFKMLQDSAPDYIKTNGWGILEKFDKHHFTRIFLSKITGESKAKGKRTQVFETYSVRLQESITNRMIREKILKTTSVKEDIFEVLKRKTSSLITALRRGDEIKQKRDDYQRIMTDLTAHITNIIDRYEEVYLELQSKSLKKLSFRDVMWKSFNNEGEVDSDGTLLNDLIKLYHVLKVIEIDIDSREFKLDWSSEVKVLSHPLSIPIPLDSPLEYVMDYFTGETIIEYLKRSTPVSYQKEKIRDCLTSFRYNSFGYEFFNKLTESAHEYGYARGVVNTLFKDKNLKNLIASLKGINISDKDIARILINTYHEMISFDMEGNMKIISQMIEETTPDVLLELDDYIDSEILSENIKNEFKEGSATLGLPAAGDCVHNVSKILL